jgi:branched-chain amino acid transport system ATP-binding protein
MTGALLSVRGLTKRYGALVVNAGVDLDVSEGQLHALIGPNGAGKTTLVHQLSGLLRCDAGAIVFDGADVTTLDMPARVRRGLARSFQITSILPNYAVLENVALAAQARRRSSYRFFGRVARDAALNAAALEALDRVGLSGRAAMAAGALSHGEKRLLEIATALALKPRLLLLDEPFAGLGQEEAAACVELLRRLKREFAILLVEHDMDAVFSLADRVSVLVNGQILAGGAPEAIRVDPAVRTAYLGDGEAA